MGCIKSKPIKDKMEKEEQPVVTVVETTVAETVESPLRKSNSIIEAEELDKTREAVNKKFDEVQAQNSTD